MKVAVIGTGIAGNAAAWLLSQRYSVTVYERELRAGGHSHTVRIDYDREAIDVDIGFIVYNELNYPELTALFAHLDVETVETCMSFSVSSDDGRFEWKGGGLSWHDKLSGLFAKRRNLLSLSYLRMLAEIARFNRQSVADYRTGDLAGLTLGEYLQGHAFAPRLWRDYLAPMGAAIWSSPVTEIFNFPAENFVAFFNNHRLLHLNRPTWRTVKSGSHCYVEKLTSAFKSRIRLGCGAISVERSDRGVSIVDSHGKRETYDHVIIAAHSDQALKLLSDADEREFAILSAIRYAPNTIYLHRDSRLMPKSRNAWASWNFLGWRRDAAALNDVSVTYWMNRLQRIDPTKPLFVSLNPPFEPAPHLTFRMDICEHPQYNARAFVAQTRLHEIQGRRRTWFCGAWTGYGFHEDGLRSGIEIGRALGVEVPWHRSDAALVEAAA
jgi:uncharacterized protein